MALQASLHTLTNDPWPGTNSSANNTANGSSNGPGTPNSSGALHSKKKLQEEYNLEFMKDCLSELLSLLAGVKKLMLIA